MNNQQTNMIVVNDTTSEYFTTSDSITAFNIICYLKTSDELRDFDDEDDDYTMSRWSDEDDIHVFQTIQLATNKYGYDITHPSKSVYSDISLGLSTTIDSPWIIEKYISSMHTDHSKYMECTDKSLESHNIVLGVNSLSHTGYTILLDSINGKIQALEKQRDKIRSILGQTPRVAVN